MKRKVRLSELLLPEEAASQTAAQPNAEIDASPPQAGFPGAGPERRPSSGAVRAMGLDLERLTSEAGRAHELERQTQNGELVVDLDPAQVDPSFAHDRMARTDDTDYRRLVDSIQTHGQQVPILVRPHPDEAGRYQVAYGHRRLAAVAEIGRRVRAVVRPLSDVDLVIAQGKENAERRNLTFIERAFFAADLEARGFDRTTLNTALAAHPTEMARYLAVARSIPRWLAEAIGPAPKAGRPRWKELAGLLETSGVSDSLRALVERPDFRTAPSDRRFEMALSGLRAPRIALDLQTFLDCEGRVILRLEPLATSTRLTVLEAVKPGLSAFLADRLPQLIVEFETGTADPE